METYFKQMMGQIITDVSNASKKSKPAQNNTTARKTKTQPVPEETEDEEATGEDDEESAEATE